MGYGARGSIRCGNKWWQRGIKWYADLIKADGCASDAGMAVRKFKKLLSGGMAEDLYAQYVKEIERSISGRA
jgi:hypothetical protein